MDRINECLMEYKGWCEKLGITTVSDVNKLIRDGKTSKKSKSASIAIIALQ